MTPMQYFQIREWARKQDPFLDRVLCEERGHERFDQVIELKSNSALVYIRPKIDFISDEVKLENPLEANYLFKLPYNCGFRFIRL